MNLRRWIANWWMGEQKQPSDAEKASVAEFLAANPGEYVAWTTLAADEETRYVVGVFYGDTRPPRYCFFAVDKATMEARVLEDDSDYRPKDWR